MRPALNAAMTDAFSAAGRRPCTNPTSSPASSARNAAWVSIAVCRSPSLDSSITGHTQYACWSLLQAARIRASTSPRRASDASFVATGRRPGGISSITDRSRSA